MFLTFFSAGRCLAMAVGSRSAQQLTNWPWPSGDSLGGSAGMLPAFTVSDPKTGNAGCCIEQQPAAWPDDSLTYSRGACHLEIPE
jgi:hypothetical protein